MLAMEGNRWMVTLGGWLGNHAPTDPARLPRVRAHAVASGHLRRDQARRTADACRHLRVPLEPAPPLRAVYEVPRQLPRDGRCALQLQSPLRPGHERRDARGAGAEGLPRARALGPRGLASVLQGCRQDHRWPVDDCRRQRLRVRRSDRREAARHVAVNWYLDRVHQAASTDRHVCRAFFDVANLLEPAPSLFRPSILARVWRECVALRGPLAIESDRSTTTRSQRMIETH